MLTTEPADDNNNTKNELKVSKDSYVLVDQRTVQRNPRVLTRTRYTFMTSSKESGISKKSQPIVCRKKAATEKTSGSADTCGSCPNRQTAGPGKALSLQPQQQPATASPLLSKTRIYY